VSEIKEVLKSVQKYIKYEMINKRTIGKINNMINKDLKVGKPKSEIIKTIDMCLEEDLITENTAAEINDYVILALESDDEDRINPDDLERDVGKSCESGACPVK
jgi:signal recognition particle GTPase